MDSRSARLYECLTGRLPRGVFKAPSKVAHHCPESIDEPVMTMLAHDPGDRPASAAAAKRLLGEAIGRSELPRPGMSAAAHATEEKRPQPARSRSITEALRAIRDRSEGRVSRTQRRRSQRPRREWKRAAATVSLAVLFLCLVLFVFFHSYYILCVALSGGLLVWLCVSTIFAASVSMLIIAHLAARQSLALEVGAWLWTRKVVGCLVLLYDVWLTDCYAIFTLQRGTQQPLLLLAFVPVAAVIAYVGVVGVLRAFTVPDKIAWITKGGLLATFSLIAVGVSMLMAWPLAWATWRWIGLDR